MQFHIDNMTCGGCARSVTKAIQSVDINAQVSADPPKRVIDVQTTATKEQVEAALREAGFPPQTL
ncbi:heavy-metal-associated domain-containing protein [Pseudomonas monteilii]|jgi:copper chaperone|uniref:heavy-metal-associated domain-containing protein n=1 Tax=Pseudomonadota TaxID=1224 RepID=UPI001E347F18|nr:heavy-metal-associated domain-containing protein [Pseudomonas monteilii]MCE0872503.1 heavy-metal-associated domain-containing protein [Pseudomonas monteilii]